MKYLLLAFFLFPACLLAQNLVPNPSFEDTLGCPNALSEFAFVQDWIAFGASPDYFNSCDKTNAAGVPYNVCGYQQAATGNAYTGLITYFNYPNYREFIGVKLDSTLIPGRKYYASMLISLADSSSYASNNIGISFSTIGYNIDTPPPITNHATIYSQSIVRNNNWVKISGIFTADSSYNYIMIGNFFDDSHTDTINLNFNSNLGNAAYYYIDDVCLCTDSNGCNFSNGINTYQIQEVNIYPNPVTEKLFININGRYNYSLANPLGVVLKSSINYESGYIDVLDIPNGLFFLTIKYQNQVIIKKLIVIH